jgi:hypothetical protein
LVIVWKKKKAARLVAERIEFPFLRELKLLCIIFPVRMEGVELTLWAFRHRGAVAGFFSLARLRRATFFGRSFLDTYAKIERLRVALFG